MPDRMKQSCQNARVLIVEDEGPLRKMMCRWVQERHDCMAVESVEEARRIMAGRMFDLLLCDIGLPGESGLRLAAEVIDSDSGMGVVMVTGQDAPEIWHEALEIGVYGYLLKPVDRLQLIISIENAIQRRRLERGRHRHIERLKRLVNKLRQVNQELKSAHCKVLAQQQEIVARERSQARFQLAGTMVHDLNQPLMILLGHLEMMTLEAHDPEKVDLYAGKVAAAGWRLAEVVRKLQAIHQLPA